jgi:hypothetical protein
LAYKYDPDGQLDLSELTLDEKKEILSKFIQMFWDADSKWHSDFGPFEDASDSSDEEFAEKLSSTPNSFVWADVSNFDQDESWEPIEGLTLYVSGWAKLPGQQEFYNNQGRVYQYIIGSKPHEPFTSPVFSLAQCECPFCEGGDSEGDTCKVCNGNGEWEVQS